MRGTKAEPLFLQLFMQSLKENGRCSVVVPDGVLFNDSNLHNDTRKHLVENFNLKKVISLNDDFFLNTGVKTSILYFVNDGKTSEVEFSELKLNKDELTENSIIKVDYKKIKELNYTLFVNKYNAKEIEKIKGVEYKKLRDVCKILPNGKRKSSEGKECGKYPLYYCSILGNLWLDEYDFNEEGIIINTTNGSGKCQVYYCEKEYSVGESVVRFGSYDNNVMTKYVYYYMKMNKITIEYLFKGSNQKLLSRDELLNMEIPIPSFSIQKKIVEQLDILSQNIQTSKQQIEESKKILKYYVETMTLWDKYDKLNNIIEYIKTGKNKPSDNKNGTKYPYFATNGISGYTDEYIFDGPLLLTPRNGTIGKIFKSNEKIFPSDHMFVLKFKQEQEQHIKYYYHYLTNCNDFDSKKHGSTIPNITKSDIEDFKIKIPSLEKQKQIVAYCDDIEETIKIMEKRIKNNEDLMKLTIETYLKNNKDIDSQSYSESSSSESESESEEEIKKVVNKPVKKTTSKKKIESSSESSNEDEDESEEEQPKKKVSKPIAKSPTKKVVKK
jgi:restriction endonuclease S subunit